MLQNSRNISLQRFVLVLAAILVGVFVAPHVRAEKTDDSDTTNPSPETTVWALGHTYQPDWNLAGLETTYLSGSLQSSDALGDSFLRPSDNRISLERPGTAEARDRERLRWNREEKAWLYSYFALNAIDAYQTMNIPTGMTEGNPLLARLAGDHPSTMETLAYKAAITYGVFKLTERMRSRKARRAVLILVNSIQLSVNMNNERVTGGILF
jgi:hypothetical protein